jgi:hypothetical protein
MFAAHIEDLEFRAKRRWRWAGAACASLPKLRSYPRDGLPPDAYQVDQFQLRHVRAVPQFFEASGNFGFILWSHSLPSIPRTLSEVSPTPDVGDKSDQPRFFCNSAFFPAFLFWV